MRGEARSAESDKAGIPDGAKEALLARHLRRLKTVEKAHLAVGLYLHRLSDNAVCKRRLLDCADGTGYRCVNRRAEEFVAVAHYLSDRNFVARFYSGCARYTDMLLHGQEHFFGDWNSYDFTVCGVLVVVDMHAAAYLLDSFKNTVEFNRAHFFNSL